MNDQLYRVTQAGARALGILQALRDGGLLPAHTIPRVNAVIQDYEVARSELETLQAIANAQQGEQRSNS